MLHQHNVRTLTVKHFLLASLSKTVKTGKLCQLQLGRGTSLNTSLHVSKYPSCDV